MNANVELSQPCHLNQSEVLRVVLSVRTLTTLSNVS